MAGVYCVSCSHQRHYHADDTGPCSAPECTCQAFVAPEFDWPTLDEVKTQVRIQGSDTMDNGLLEECRVAAREHILDRINRGELIGEVPPPVRRAAVMLAARLFKRRDSLDGSLGMPDVGVVRVDGARDWDIEQLLFPYIRIPVA